MDDDLPTAEEVVAYVEPHTSTVRTFGVLNIVFSLLIGCMCLYTLGIGVVMPYIAASVEKASDDIQQKQDEIKQEELAALDEQIENAETEEEKELLRSQREQVATVQEVQIPNMFSAMSNPKLLAYFIVDGTTGLLLNTLMLISGIGLLYRKEWARKLALWVAGLKIVRQIILQLVNIAVIVPIQMDAAKQMFEQMNQNGPPAPPVDMAGIQGIMYTAMAVFTLVIGCMYPALTLWFLSRPGAKVVCSPEYEEFPRD